MKAIISIIVTCILLSTAIVNAQNSPPPPPVISNHSDTTSSSTSSSYNVSRRVDGKNKKGGNISISISENTSSYSMNARFPENRYSAVYEVLSKELGNGIQGNNKNKYRWISNAGSKEVYEVELWDNRLSLDLDKDISDQNLIVNFKTLSKLIRNAISGKDVAAERQTQNLQRQADRLQREADHMRRESERMQREADRLKRSQDRIQEQGNRNAARYERDAQRLAVEGARIAEEANRFNRNAADRGGTSAVVASFLKLPITKMTVPFERTNNWNWPNAQNKLIEQLLVDKTITSDSEVVFSRDRNDIFVNGVKMNALNKASYNRILLISGISMVTNFTFYKEGNHIVIVDNMARVEAILRDLKRRDIISNLDDKIEIEINGATALINGEQQSASTISEINRILKKRNIIPAPGKTIKISETGNYTLGYSRDKVHLGTWIAND